METRETLPNEETLKKHLSKLVSVTSKLSQSPAEVALVGPILSLYDEIYQNTAPGDTRITRAKTDLLHHDLIKKMSKDQKELIELLIDLREALQPLFKAEVVMEGMRRSGMAAGSKKLAGEESLQALIEQMKDEGEEVVISDDTKKVLGVLAELARNDEKKSDVFSPDRFTLQLMARVFDAEETNKDFLDKTEKAENDLRDKIYLAAVAEALKGYKKLVDDGKIKDPMVGTTGDPKPFSEQVKSLLTDKDKKMSAKSRMEAVRKTLVEVQPKIGRDISNIHAERLNRFIGLINKKLGTKIPYYRSEKAKEIKRHMQTLFAKSGVTETEKSQKKPKKRSGGTGLLSP